MKKIGMILVAVLIVCGSLFACSSEKAVSNPPVSDGKENTVNPVPEDDVVLKSSNKLIVYRYPLLGEQMDYAVDRYKKQYPDVEVEYRDFGDASDSNAPRQFSEILRSELSAGKGPDLIVAPPYAISSDFAKTEKTGAFLDIRGKLLQDPEIQADAFTDGWLTLSGVGEQQCFVPLSYATRQLFADQAVLEENGVDITKLSQPADFRSAIEQWEKNKKAGTSLWNANSYGLWLVLPWCGAEAVDYENHALRLDENFRNAMELYKLLYEDDMVKPQADGWRDPYSTAFSGEAGRNLSQGMHLFVLGVGNSTEITEFRAIDEGGRVILPFPSSSEKTVAEVQDVACINAASENTENAYRFLTVLLSENVQEKWVSCPVNKNAMSSALTASLSAQYTDDAGNVLTTPLTAEEKSGYISMFTKDLEWHLPMANGVSDIIWGAMEPYFQDQKTYEECLRELENRLTIYLDE